MLDFLYQLNNIIDIKTIVKKKNNTIIIMVIIYILILIIVVFFNSERINNNKQIINKLNIFRTVKNNIINIKKKLGINTNFGFVLKHNYPIIQYLINSYGYESILELTKYTEDIVDIFYVGNIYDAINLRKYNITKPIILMYLFDPNLVNLAEQYDIEIVIPNIEWYHLAIPYINNSIKCHLWFNSGLNKEGVNSESELLKLYNQLTKLPKIKLVGIGTKYNTSDKSFNKNKFNLLPDDIYKQHKIFQNIVSKINNSKLNIHTACTFEVDRNFKDSYFNTVRVGKLIYRNNVIKQPILDIKYYDKDACFGYYCVNTKKKYKNKIKVALISNNLKLNNNTNKDVKIYTNNNEKLKFLYYDYNPCAILIPDNVNLKIGDTLNIKYNDLYAYI